MGEKLGRGKGHPFGQWSGNPPLLGDDTDLNVEKEGNIEGVVPGEMRDQAPGTFFRAQSLFLCTEKPSESFQ